MKKRTEPKVFLGLLCTYGKLFNVFSLFLAITLSSSTWVLGQQATSGTISVDLKDVSVLRALYEINRLGGNLVTFNEETVMKEQKKVTLKLTDVTVLKAVHHRLLIECNEISA